jgi:ATP-dependent DNA helicase RecQ
MPKSMENYLQECGRAGRDGMEAHCLMFHSVADAIAWERLAAGSGDPAMIRMTREKIDAMRKFCNSVRCRRVELLAHFGEEYPAASCGRCDNCLRGSLDAGESTVLAQKILSCIKRLGESRNAVYTAKVLVGAREAEITAAGHDRLSTHGLLSAHTTATVERWIEELAAAGMAEREWRGGALRVTAAGWRVLRGEATTVLSRPSAPARAGGVPGEVEDHDPALFEALRAWRMARARELGVPPYVVFGDRTLRELARIRPTALDSLHRINGIGDRKHAEHGEALMGVLLDWYAAHPAMPTDQWDGAPAASPPPRRAAPQPPAARTAMINRAIAAGHDIVTLAEVLGRARSTTVGLIVDHLRAHGAPGGCPWVTAAQLEELRAARGAAPGGRLRPIHEALGGRLDFDTIRIGLALLEHEDGG